MLFFFFATPGVGAGELTDFVSVIGFDFSLLVIALIALRYLLVVS